MYRSANVSPRPLQTDAQSITLVRCITEDALAWIYTPTMSALPDDGEDDNPGRDSDVRGRHTSPGEQDGPGTTMYSSTGVHLYQSKPENKQTQRQHCFETLNRGLSIGKPAKLPNRLRSNFPRKEANLLSMLPWKTSFHLPIKATTLTTRFVAVKECRG